LLLSTDFYAAASKLGRTIYVAAACIALGSCRGNSPTATLMLSDCSPNSPKKDNLDNGAALIEAVCMLLRDNI
jgi:hypothetical protein